MKRLNDLGMVWKPLADRWETAYTQAEEYRKEHGNLQIPYSYKTRNGFMLGDWVFAQREKKRAGELTQEQIDRLEAIGMDWLSPTARAWETNFAACQRYYLEHGNLDMPTTYTAGDGSQLGLWLWRIRTGRTKLHTDGENGDQVARLESIGMKWPKKVGEENEQTAFTGQPAHVG